MIIDDTGLSGGVTDRLNELKSEGKLSGVVIVPVNFLLPFQTRKQQKNIMISHLMHGPY